MGSQSYKQIFKSTTVIGGAQAVNVAIGIVRVKILAVLLGPVGVGLMGTLQSIMTLAGNVSSLGMGSSGVRQIAEAAGSGDSGVIGRTVKVMRRIALWLGIIGTIVLASFCVPVSRLTFGTDEYAWAVAAISITVLFAVVSSAQTALVQGLRRIRDLSLINIMGPFAGTVLGIPIIIVWGYSGIVPMLVIVSATTLAASWWFARRVKIDETKLNFRETASTGSDMLKLGVAFLVSGSTALLASYIIRAFIIRRIDIDAAGQYQAAFTIAGQYVAFILQSMGADFYPRLTAVSKDNSAVNNLVNEQIEVALLLAAPAILASMALAPFVIWILYSSSFTPAVELLRWFALGLAIRVISWPAGFVAIAKGRGGILIVTELTSNTIYVLLTVIGMHFFGLVGTAVAFVGFYAFYLALVFFIAGRLSGFCISKRNLLMALITVGLAGLFLALSYRINATVFMSIGIAACLVTALFSFRRIVSFMKGTRFERILAKLPPFITGMR